MNAARSRHPARISVGMARTPQPHPLWGAVVSQYARRNTLHLNSLRG